MVATMPHKGSSPRLLSPKVWGRLPVHLWNVGVQGTYLFDDFINAPQLGADQDVRKYASYIDTGVTIQQNSDEFGVLEWAGNDADNDEGVIQAGGNTGASFHVDGSRRLAFEARLKKGSVADNALAIFVGLAAAGNAVTGFLVDDTGAVIDTNFIGFHVDQADGDSLDFTYKADGQTVQVPISGLATVAADTYFKVGFLVDPNRPPSKRLTVYLDNTEQDTYVTQTSIDAATFPNDVGMTLTAAAKVGAVAEVEAQLDWWAVGAEEQD